MASVEAPELAFCHSDQPALQLRTAQRQQELLLGLLVLAQHLWSLRQVPEARQVRPYSAQQVPGMVPKLQKTEAVRQSASGP